MRRFLALLLFVFLPVFARSAQQPATGGVIRITVSLVQVDAVVTDSKGRQVTNLKPEDFEIIEDGAPRPITNFSYIPVRSAAAAGAAARALPAGGTLLLSPGLQPEQVGRTMALVVDDIGLSFESTYYVRRALKKFVDEQMQPGDLVAILRTGAGLGALQQFTTDKRLLYAAIDRVRFNLAGQSSVGEFLSDAEANKRPGFVNDLFTAGTLGALNYIVNGLRDLPGRKSVILFSDGMVLPGAPDLRRVPHGPHTLQSPVWDDDIDPRLQDKLQALIELANRSSVVIYTLDARGIATLQPTASETLADRSVRAPARIGPPSSPTASEVQNSLSRRHKARLLNYYDSQQGLGFLAQQTGGLFVHDTNDLSWGVGRILEDQAGYYLIGFKPSEGTFEKTQFGASYHKIQVRVLKPGLKVRSRNGFYGVTDEQARPVYRTELEQLAAALTSPFSSGGIRLHLASQLLYDAHNQTTARCLLHIDARDVQFVSQPDGRKHLALDLAAVIFGDNGQVVDGKLAVLTGSPDEEGMEAMLQRGLDYVVDIPVGKAGGYQLRAGVRDSASQRVGSAGLFMNVPNTRSRRLGLSGIILNPKGVGDKSPAVRRFEVGDEVTFAMEIYNARLDPATHLPNLEESIQLYRDTQQVLAFNRPFGDGEPSESKRLSLAGTLRLGPELEPGDYALEITVTDKLARKKYATASQWIDFEIAVGGQHPAPTPPPPPGRTSGVLDFGLQLPLAGR
ncbi:MAG: VWA domain-containing protein [Terriglobia bacterium]